MAIEVTEKPEESRDERKCEILEIGKEIEGHLDEEKDVEDNETDGDEVVQEHVEENLDEGEEVNGGPDEEADGEGSYDEGENEENGVDEEKQTEDEETPAPSAKKRSRKGGIRNPEELQSRRPGIDRPSRERKTVERYIVPETARIPYGKSVSIEKGRGIQLKDIPNVAFKLTKRKANENLQLLHTILFGRKAKVHSLKRNIGLFSGFVWIESEQEKQRSKIKEKFNKCIKEKLVDFCEILDISINRATSKKEELSAKLLEFLESPHATTDTLLDDKEKIKRLRSNGSASRIPGFSVTDGRSSKKQKLDNIFSKHSYGEDDKSENDQHDGEVRGTESGINEDLDEPEEKRNVSAKISKERTKPRRAVVKSKPVPKVPPKKRKVEMDPNSDSKPVSKKNDNSSFRKDKGDGQSSKNVAKNEPSRSELSAQVMNILQKLDLNTATLSDILRQLGDHFDVNLMDRKLEIKEIITEVTQNMSDDDNEDEHGNEEEKEA